MLNNELNGESSYLVYPFLTTWLDYPDNSNIAIGVYFTGCVHNCHNCHNKELQHYGSNAPGASLFSLDEFINELKEVCYRNKTKKVVLEGGDPLFPTNIKFVKSFLKKNIFFDICIYTGYDIDDVPEDIIGFNYIKTGKYDETKKRNSMKTDYFMQLASSNQKIYNKNRMLVSHEGLYSFC